jgi:DNA-directed RNA polymerase subunit M/transcription elongation factor TFIIS
LVASVLTRQINNILLRYFCSNCNTLLKKTYESIDNSRLLINPAEECPTCGCLLSKTLKRELKSEQQQQQQNRIQSQSRSSPLPKFQTAYEQIDSRLTFDIEKIDDSISLKTGETVCIIDERKYTKILLARLCVRALLPKRHGGGGGNGFESSNVIVIDAGNSLDIYQHVNFARQYGLDIKKVLQHIIVSRVFTIYQLTNIIVNEMPKIIEQYDGTKLIVIYDLLDMFLRDPQLEVEEGQRLVKEIISSLKQRREIFGDTLIATSLSSSPHHNYKHRSSPSSSAPYHKILLPRFDKHIEVTARSADNKKKISTTSLEAKVKDNSKDRSHSKHYNNSSHSCIFPIEERDLLLVTPR